jgi:hypothetical protein
MPQILTAEIINAAIEGFESQKRRIDSQIDELRQLLKGDRTEVAADSQPPARNRKVTAAARRRMAEAQKARWAKVRGEVSPPSQVAPPEAPKRKRRLSAAGRKAISEAAKQRWALKRAAAQTARPVAGKKAAVQKSATKKTAAKRTPKAAAKTPEAAVTAKT